MLLPREHQEGVTLLAQRPASQSAPHQTRVVGYSNSWLEGDTDRVGCPDQRILGHHLGSESGNRPVWWRADRHQTAEFDALLRENADHFVVFVDDQRSAVPRLAEDRRIEITRP